MPTLRAVDVPQLWALGGQDIDAPAGEIARRIKGLIAEGRPITLAVFPKAEHGMTEFETAPDGSRVRSEEHTSELQSLMRISYAVFCLKKKKKINNTKQYNQKKTRIQTTR